MLTGAADELARATQGSGVPMVVTFQVTDRCNYRCTHCYQQHDQQSELTTEAIERVFSEIANENVMFLTLMGGEFFMRPDADRLLRSARELGFALRVLSTGHHITEKRADFLKTLNPIAFDLSLYGPDAERHEEITDQKGSFERTVRAARRLLARGIPVRLKSPMMDSNASSVKELEALADEMGATFSSDPYLSGMEDANQDPVALRMSQATLNGFYADQPEVLQVLTRSPSSLDTAPCRAGHQSVFINAKGEVWPCGSLPWPVGNVQDAHFRDIWYGNPALEEIRDLTWASLAECNVCPVRKYCKRCHGMAYLEQGELRGPSLEACRHAVAVRDQLIARGLAPKDETDLPPTWERVERNGQHHRVAEKSVRSSRLRVL